MVFNDLWSLSVQLHAIPWQPFADGVDIHPLHTTESGDIKVALLRNAPGVAVPEHQHGGYEFILVLSGSEYDEHGKYDVGDLVINPPGSIHAVKSDEGNVVLVIWETPVTFLHQ